jgi:hypothetical protein|tara:strand:+ start:100 stop:219 length:120 start_codon:yes stop_codon:yes gene_type:complete
MGVKKRGYKEGERQFLRQIFLNKKDKDKMDLLLLSAVFI